MYKPLSIALYSGGLLIVLAMALIISVTSFRLVHLVVFSGTLDGRLVAFILLLALLPAGVGIALFGYFLYQHIRRSITGGPVAERDYIGRFLESRTSQDDR